MTTDPNIAKAAKGWSCSYERAEVLFRVLERAVDLAIGGAGSFGHCVDEAFKVENVEPTETESRNVLLTCARATMALGDLKRREKVE